MFESMGWWVVDEMDVAAVCGHPGMKTSPGKMDQRQSQSAARVD
jgi:hypothetical protein